jgi:protein translocase SecG subunit
MLHIINYVEIVVAILLTVSILLQQRGAGLSRAFGGDFGGYYTRRGFEKFLVIASIILAVAFIGLAIASLIVSSQAVPGA